MRGRHLLYGDGVRIGIEDNIWYDEKRTRHVTNADLIKRVGCAAHLLERRLASPEEVRERLGIQPLR